ncbi:MAG: methyltransferase domain-containing protein [Candidatus Falkowbacteria bacterium]
MMLKDNFKSGFIPRVLIKNPATFEMLERVYLKNGESELDNYFINSLSGQALRDRLDAVINHGVINILQLTAQDNFKIVNCGCGTSRDLVAIMSHLRDQNIQLENIINVDCVDVDVDALAVARELVMQENLTKNFNLINKNFLSLNYYHNVKMAFVIGVLCSLPHNRCVALLKKLKKYFAKDCIVVVSNVSTTMREQDPDMAYSLKEIIGWNLVYKTIDELKCILKAAGYKWLGCFYDEPLRFHAMGIATPIDL